MTTEFYGESEDEFEDEKSKSQIKRELLELKALGRTLISLPVKDLDKLVLPERLYESVVKAQSMSHGALKRETGFIGRLIADEDHETIAANVAKLKQVHQGEVKQFHELEQWRDHLLSGNNDVMTMLHQQLESFDGQYVRQLVRNAAKEAKLNKSPKSARLLFKYLQACQVET
jgi:ribosome-associated protein